MMKRTINISLHIVLVLVIYITISALLLGHVVGGKTETAIYDMGVVWEETSEILGSIAEYHQWFYVPCECSGIQLAMATDQMEAQKELVICINDASSGELLGEYIVEPEKIRDNQYVDIMFEEYTLEEGKQYFFDAYTNGENKNSLRFWMGTSSSEFCLNTEYAGEVLQGTSIAFNLIYEYTDKNFVIWMFVSVLCMLCLLKIWEIREKKCGDKKIEGWSS